MGCAMNDPSVLDMQTLNRDALLNDLLYLNHLKAENSESLNTILDNTENHINGLIANKTDKDLSSLNDELRRINAIRQAIKRDPEFGNLVMANKTESMSDPSTGLPYEKGGLSACTFQDKYTDPTNVTVVFRGTGKAEWYDNGLGLSGELVATDQQIQATEYFDFIVEENGWDQTNPHIHITGHSKGGNKTQFVVMTSKYTEMISSGYSLDGQCMSPEAIEYFKEKYGVEEYNKRRNKLFAIAADNDYVNVLGANKAGRLIPDNHIFFLKSNKGLEKWHFADCYINDDGTLTEFTEQGDVSLFLQGMSEELMCFPAPIRSILTEGLMAIGQMTLGGNAKPVNGETFSYRDVFASVPLFISFIPAGIVELVETKFGVDLDWLSNVLTAVALIHFAPLIIRTYVLGAVIDLVLIAKEKLISLGKKCVELTKTAVDYIDRQIKKLQKWFDKTFGGSGSSCYTSEISINTYSLHMYSGRLRDVNRRITYVDSRLDTLYSRVGLKDLWNLLQADLLTGFSWKLLRCSEYLDVTANEFDRIETKLIES